MRLSISQAAQRSGVSVRTLRYYDEIGLLKPSEVTPAGYRYYDGPALETLQQIVFYRELGLPLEQISTILRAPDHNRTEALRRHRQLLLMKRRRLDDMLRLLDETIGGTAMYNEMPRPTRNEVDDLKAQYAREAADRWGNTRSFPGELGKARRLHPRAGEADPQGDGGHLPQLWPLHWILPPRRPEELSPPLAGTHHPVPLPLFQSTILRCRVTLYLE